MQPSQYEGDKNERKKGELCWKKGHANIPWKLSCANVFSLPLRLLCFSKTRFRKIIRKIYGKIVPKQVSETMRARGRRRLLRISLWCRILNSQFGYATSTWFLLLFVVADFFREKSELTFAGCISAFVRLQQKTREIIVCVFFGVRRRKKSENAFWGLVARWFAAPNV